ncbi:GntR family transcriptional regulator [Candidatus Sodalis endolongispinus]|uniref:GntR family transcriptional regulator n=1 Tax=Candidatus Sodalis endolongispinus TaxID=2812662 RepID=A0ABS5YBL5_9GAMM|nr:GntR family transcriptional regulator [Candidatus Sodalis endolongispinus]MBT9432413.1 GntR family transcriptional regulator [Candidatus Sodalis endolongispinus]
MKPPKVNFKQQIVQDMVSGFWQPGDRLTLSDLAGRYQASQTPVREALRELYGEGFLEIGAGKTFQLRPLSVAFIENIFDIRSCLEVMLVKTAANKCRAADILQLKTLNHALAEAVSQVLFDKAIEKNREFHDVINGLADNPEATRILKMHWIFIASLWKQVDYVAARYTGVVSDHDAIIQAFVRQDADAAASLMGAHVVKAKFELIEKVKNQALSTGDGNERFA